MVVAAVQPSLGESMAAGLLHGQRGEMQQLGHRDGNRCAHNIAQARTVGLGLSLNYIPGCMAECVVHRLGRVGSIDALGALTVCS